MKSEICIIRHGVTTGNEQHLYYGSTEVSLSESGEETLKELRAKGIYPDNDVAEYFTSGMLRTEQSFYLIYGNQDHETIPELRELDFGDFEMKGYKELESKPEYQKWINDEDGNEPPPNGESTSHFKERVLKGFETLKNRNAMKCFLLRNKGKMPLTICICHGGPISVIMNSIWPEKHANFYEWIPDPGHGYLLELEDGKVVAAKPF